MKLPQIIHSMNVNSHDIVIESQQVEIHPILVRF